MNFSFDYFHNLEDVDFTLCNPDERPLYVLQVVDRKLVLRFNDLSSLSFTAFSKLTTPDGANIENEAYDFIETKRLVKVDRVGWFQITQVDENDDGVIKTKSVSCESLETVLKNLGVSSENRLYCFYNAADPYDANYDASNVGAIPSVLGQLNRQLGIQQDLHSFGWEPSSEYEDWTVTYVTRDLIYIGNDKAKCRTLDEGTAYGYDWIKNTIQDAFGVIVLFDFMHKSIRIADVSEVTQHSDLLFTFSNFTKNIQITEDSKDIVTVLNCSGGNDCDIRMVNPLGTNYICNFDYYKYDGVSQDPRWMSEELSEKLDDWEDYVESQRASFEEKVQDYYDALGGVSDIKDELLPEISVRCNDLNNAVGQYTEYYANGGHGSSLPTGFVAVENVKIGETSLEIASSYYNTAIASTSTVTAYKTAPTFEDGKWVFTGAYRTDTVANLCNVNITLVDKEPQPEYLYFSDGDLSSFCKLKAKAVLASRGNRTFANLPTPSEYNVGTVFTVTDSFTSDSRFIEGSGHSRPSGTIVAVVENNEHYYYTYTNVFIYTCAGFTRFISFNSRKIDRYDDVTYDIHTSGIIDSVTVVDESKFVAIFNKASLDNIAKNRYVVIPRSNTTDDDREWSFANETTDDIEGDWGISVSYISGDPSLADYFYITCTPTLQYWYELQEARAESLEATAAERQAVVDSIEDDIKEIQDACDIVNYFAGDPDLYAELKHYWIEGDYSNDKIEFLDTTTTAEKITLERELLEAARVELAKVSQPRMSFSLDAIDFTKIYDFRRQANELTLGKRVYVEYEEGTWFEPAVLQISLDLDSPDDFSLEFANAMSLNDWGYTYADLISDASSTSRQVSENWYGITNYTRDKEKITSIIENPLDMTLRAGLSNLTNQSFSVNDSGILGRKEVEDGGFSPEQVRMVNNLLMFTDDGWKTAKTALGKIYYTDEHGVTQSSYGLIAETIIGQLIVGNTMEIKDESGRITINGSGINVNNNFIVDSSGNVSLNGNIQWGTGSSPTQVLYARTMLTKPTDGSAWSSFPETSTTGWHRTGDDLDMYGSYTYNGGESWGTPIKIRAKDGTSVSIKASAAECQVVGDGYIDEDGHLQILTVLSPRTFADAGEIRGPAGAAGTNGINTAIVYLYMRSASAPTAPSYSGTFRYNFETHRITFPTDWDYSIGWVSSIPDNDGNSLYVTTAIAAGTDSTTTISASAWSTPVVLAANGINGKNGRNGDSVKTAYAYRLWDSPIPPQDRPAAGSAPSSPWTSTPSGVSDSHKYEYISTCEVTNNSYGTWTNPVLWAKLGADGEPGSDASVTATNVFNALTHDGELFGCFEDIDGGLYINASYLNTGILNVLDENKVVFSADINNGLVTLGGFNATFNSLYGYSAQNAITTYLHSYGVASVADQTDRAQNIWVQESTPTASGQIAYDLWYRPSTGNVYRRQNSQWNLLSGAQIPPMSLLYVNQPDGIARRHIYYGSAALPTTYQCVVGDLWVQNASSSGISATDKIMVCVRSYNEGGARWVEAGNYMGFYSGISGDVDYQNSLRPSLIDPDRDSPVRIYAGTDMRNVSKNAIFSVSEDGSLYASAAKISGTIFAGAGEIGGWTIASDRLSKNTGSNITVDFIHESRNAMFGQLASEESEVHSQKLFSQLSDPSTTWTSEEKSYYVYSLWHNTSENATSYWNGSGWTAWPVPMPVFYVGASGGVTRKNIFYGAGNYPDTYYFGDYWVKNNGTSLSENDEVMFCIRDSEDGYQSEDWATMNGSSAGIYSGTGTGTTTHSRESLVTPGTTSSVRFYAGAEAADAPSSGRFVLCEDGSLYASGASISGILNAGNGSYIGGWHVENGGMMAVNSFGTTDTTVLLSSVGIILGTRVTAPSYKDNHLTLGMDDDGNPYIAFRSGNFSLSDVEHLSMTYQNDVLYITNKIQGSPVGICIDGSSTSGGAATGSGVLLGVTVNGMDYSARTGWLKYNDGSGTKYALFIRGLLITTGGSANVNSNPYGINNIIT